MSNGEFGLTAFAGKTPEKEFLVFKDRRLTYEEVNRRVNPLAHGLQSRRGDQ